MKRLLFMFLFPILLLAQTSKNGRIQVGPLAAGPGLPLPCSPSDQWNTNDGHGAYICVTTNSWQQIGGGGTNYQTIQTASSTMVQEPILKFPNLTCVDNPGNNSTDCTALYQFVLNNASVLPQEPRWNAVPPLQATDNAANTRTDLTCPAYVGVGGGHSSGCMIDPGASGQATDYAGRDAQWHTSVSAGTILPDISAGIQYVASLCNGGSACSDANDGLSWGSAKASPYAALLALPGGSASPPTAGHGVVHVSSDPINGIPFGGPIGGGLGGWWMFGSTDPGFAGGVTGWMRVPTNGLKVTLQCDTPASGVIHSSGATCQEFWGGHTDSVHPAIWWNGFSGQAELRGFSFNFESNPIKIGIASNGDRANGGTTSVLLNTVNANQGGCYSGIGAGPALDIGGNSFWIWVEHSSFSGCTTQDYSITAISRTANVVTVTLNKTGTGDIVATNNAFILIRNVPDKTFNGSYLMTSASGTSVTFAQIGPNASSSGGQAFPYGAAAIGINSGTGAGSGFIYVNDTAVNGGGIWALGGFNGVGLSANKIIYEGSGFPDMPVIEDLAGGGGDTAIYVNDVQYADNTVSICGFENTGTGGNVSVQNTTVCGPAEVFHAGAIDNNVLPGRQGQFGDVSAPGRNFAPYAVQYPNLAGPSSTWNLLGVTKTDGQRDPSGGTGATLTTNNTGVTTNMRLAINSTGQVVGQNIIFGGWLRGPSSAVSPVSMKYAMNEDGFGSGTSCKGSYLSGQAVSQVFSNGPPVNSGDGQWQFYGGICNIVTVGSQSTSYLEVIIPNSASIYIYGLVLTLIPAGSISDNEVYAIFANMQSYPATASVGDITTMTGQHLRTDDLVLNPITAPTGASGSSHVYMDLASSWPAFKPNGNTPYFMPGFTGAWTTGLCATATSTVNVFNLGTCGSGSGTINPASQFFWTYYSGAGSSSTLSGATAPSGPASVFEFAGEIPTGSAPTAPVFALAGIPGRSDSSGAPVLGTTDRANRVVFASGSTQAVSISDPSASGFGQNYVVRLKATASGTVPTVTPTTATINGAANLVMHRGEVCGLGSADNTTYYADCFDPPITSCVGCTVAYGDNGITLTNTTSAGDMIKNSTNTMGASGTIDGSAMATTAGMKTPVGAGAAPTADGAIANNSTNHTFDWGSNGTTMVGAIAATGTGTATTCTNQFVSSVSSLAVPACNTVTPAFAAGNTNGSGNFALTTGAALVTPDIGTATGAQLLLTGRIDGTAPVTVSTGTAVTLGGTFKSGYTFNQRANPNQGNAIVYTLPVAAAGLQYCVSNSNNGTSPTTGTLEFLTSGGTQFIIFTDGTLSAGGGFVISGGAAGDAGCVVGVDATHWQLYVNRGTWTLH